jgi:dTDP-4-amino-4,6-dideoxygalactose transaminase
MEIKVPFVGYKIQYKVLRDEILKTIDDVLSRGDLILRKDTEEFEKSLAEFVGVKYAVGLNSCTDALFLSLKALNIGQGDEVITVSHTFVASIATIFQTGATPVLVDVGEDFLMDMDKVEAAITEKTKAIIPVHLNGRMCDMDKVQDIAKKHNLIVIEDAAQALGSSFNGRKAGSIGVTGCFSFYPAKILGCPGDGGALTTNSAEIAEKVRLLRDHGQKTKTEILCFGWNSRLDNLQAAILNIKLKYFPKWLERRREIAGLYQQGLSGVSGIKLPPSPDSDSNRFDVFQNYVLKAQKRDELFSYLKEKGVETLIKDPVPNHWQKGLSISHFKLPYSEQLAKEVISLPMYPELEDGQINYVIEQVKSFYKK